MKEGHIFIDGVIPYDYQKYINDRLAALAGADKIILHIQSPGGSVYGGFKAYQALKSSGKKIEAIIEGECSSIATLIMLAADKITAHNPSVIMVHLPANEINGTADEFESGASQLRAIEADMIALYAERTKLPPEQIRELMRKETYMNATQAKDLGFIDEITEPLRAVAVGKPFKNMINNKEKQTAFDKLTSAFAAARRELFGPYNMDLTTDKGVITIDSTDGEFVGKPATIAGAPAPDGEYKLDDGRVLTVTGGIVTVIMEPDSAAPQESADQAKIKALEAEIATLKTQAQAAEQSKIAAEAKVQESVVMFGKLEAEFKELRSKTVGDNKPAAAAPVAEKKPNQSPSAQSDADKAMQDELFEIAGIKHLFKQN